MPVSPGLRAFFAKLAQNRAVKKGLARGVRAGIHGFRKTESFLRPRLANPDKLGKLAFRTDVASSAAGVGLVGWAARSQYKEDQNIKKAQLERQKALKKFKQLPSRQRIRRVGGK